MLALLIELTDAAAGHCELAEARWVGRERDETITVNGALERAGRETEEGIGVRVRANGAWGFAATTDCTRAGAQDALRRALALARAQPRGSGAALAPAPAARGAWSSPCEQDPLAVSLDEKLAVLLAADAQLAGDPLIARREGRILATRTRSALATSEGTAIEQDTTQCAGGIMVTALAGGLLQQRSYPAGHGGGAAQAGWEHVLGLDLPGNAARCREEALMLLAAPQCPAGTTDVILGSEQLALQVHESVGHALELDRMLLGEASYAGTSWVAPGDVGRLRYGSELMQVSADATLPGALGSFGWDDEGVPAQRFALVRDGVLAGTLSSRETAAAVGLGASGGCMRADGFARQPIVRMTNVSLHPGDAGSLDDLIAATEEGLLLETNRSWSIDDRRLNFQFTTEVAWEIRDGERGRLLRDATYAGATPTFWSSLDAVCSAGEWRVHGLLNCGKGEPGQVMEVSHGAAPARFRGVAVRPA